MRRVAAIAVLWLAACGGAVSPQPSANAVPRARLGAPLYAPPGEPITFDASHSYDPDGAIVEYTFVFSDSAHSETTTSASPEVAHVFTAPGAYDVRVYVRDEGGLRGQATQLVVVRTDPPRCVTTADCDLGTECRDSRAAGTPPDPVHQLCYATGPGLSCPSGACAADCAVDADCKAGWQCRIGVCLSPEVAPGQ